MRDAITHAAQTLRDMGNADGAAEVLRDYETASEHLDEIERRVHAISSMGLAVCDFGELENLRELESAARDWAIMSGEKTPGRVREAFARLNACRRQSAMGGKV